MKAIKSLKIAPLGVLVILLIAVLFASGCAGTGEIVIEKVTIIGPEATQADQEFQFTLTGGPSELKQSFNLTNNQSYFSGEIISGSGYNASEMVPDGWSLTSATCDDGSPVDNIDVASGETVTCTFENTKKVEIVIYTDFQCPSCWMLSMQVEGELSRLYVDTGKADLDIRLIPALGLDSLRATEAALCAADQDQFREYRDAIFAEWAQSGRAAYSEERLLVTASELGLNDDAFSTCLQSGEMRAEVEANMSLAQTAGVSHVPTMLINDVKVVGFKPLETYVQIIDELFAR
jgi:protein-disulfide isomerase